MYATELRHYLLSDSTVAGLIGTRYYARQLEQNATLPAVAASLISNVDAGKLAGASEAQESSYQLDCFAATQGGADALAAAVRDALHTLWAAAPSAIGEDSEVIVTDVETSGPRHDSQLLPGGSDQHQYASSLDVRLWTKAA